MDDPQACDASLGRLRGLAISTVFPGHGRPFRWEELPVEYRGLEA
jgi:hypothetical protein